MNLSGGNERCVRATMQAGVFPIVLEELKRHGIKASSHYITIIMNLASNEGCDVKEEMIRAGVLRDIVDHLGAESSDGVDVQAFCALRSLAKGSQRCKRAVVTSGALSLLVQCLGSTNSSKLEQSLCALYELAW